jgi:hypothetical protein
METIPVLHKAFLFVLDKNLRVNKLHYVSSDDTISDLYYKNIITYFNRKRFN